MNESIDREEAEKRLDAHYKSAANSIIIHIIFPPFEPKEGEVYWSGYSEQFVVHIVNSKISDNSRPLTDREKGL